MCLVSGILITGACFKWETVCLGKLIEINTLRPRKNGRLFADDTFKHIFLNENITISIKFLPDNKPLSEPMMA